MLGSFKMKTRLQKGLGLAALLVPVLAIGLIDWLIGPRVECAWLSGQALARKVAAAPA